MRIPALALSCTAIPVLIGGLLQIVAWLSFGDGQVEMRTQLDIFYTPLFGIMPLGLGVYSLWLVTRTHGDFARLTQRQTAAIALVWVSSFPILFLAVLSIYSLCLGWARVT